MKPLHKLFNKPPQFNETRRENDELRKWADRHYAAPSPPHVKRKVLLRNGMPSETWVETGTYLGSTTQTLSLEAKFVYSIEPEPELFSKAKERFSNHPNVEIVFGTSEARLEGILEKISGDVSFWLDGHFSAGVTHKGAMDTPIALELAMIEKAIGRLGKVVIMIDDVRCFGSKDPEHAEYPPLEFLVEWANKNHFSWHIEHDIFVAVKN
jgi:hypothetical protein